MSLQKYEIYVLNDTNISDGCSLQGENTWMKIAFMVYEFPPYLVGGLGTYAQYVTREFVKLGHDVTVFTMHRGAAQLREILGGVEVRRYPTVDATDVFAPIVSEDLKRWGTYIRVFSDIFIYNVISASDLVSELKESRFDIISFHDWLSCISALISRKHTALPLVFHVHSTEWGRTGNGSQVIKYLEERASVVADRVITVSHAMKEDLVKHGWPEQKISVVWNGVDANVYNPDKCKPEEVKAVRNRYNVSEEENMLLFVGRLTWVKGVRNLIQAMPLILRDHPNTKLVILGRGEEQKDIEELINRLGLSNRVYYRFEFIPENERILHYAAADLCVFPSIYEPFGIVSLEAMAMKKPIVVGASGVSGFREQVVSSGPDQNGVHINGNDPADIAWGVNLILSDKGRALKMGENGRKRVLSYFTWDKVAQQTIDIYASLIK
jgi:glycosyltransferase involved in cell wall biosynthesis